MHHACITCVLFLHTAVQVVYHTNAAIIQCGGVHCGYFFYQIGQFRMCHGPLWAKFRAKYRFRQCQGAHTGFSSWLGPHVFPLTWLWLWRWSCQRDFPLVWIPVRFVSWLLIWPAGLNRYTLCDVCIHPPAGSPVPTTALQEALVPMLH